jgi:hypothetical protein
MATASHLIANCIASQPTGRRGRCRASGCAQAELVLRSAYRAFKARYVEAAIELMHPEVDGPTRGKAVG